MSRPVIAVLAALSLSFLAPPLRAETSRVPYAALYESLRPALEINGRDRLVAKTKIQSKRPGIRPEEIQLQIHSRAGVREIRVERDGDVAFPLDERLRDENPIVQSNQPKGSLTLSVAIGLKVPTATRFAYREIAIGIDQLRSVMASDGADNGGQVRGVEFWFAPGSDARLGIIGPIERLFIADRFGRIVLHDSAELREAGVMLELSESPLQILPSLRPGAR